MTKRFDHAAEATSTLKAIGYPETTKGCIAHAQVHATLALVEQQRIANLIAWTTAPGYAPNSAADAAIAEALGL